MNYLPVYLLFLVLWLSLFAQTQFDWVRNLLGVPLSVIPALVVYTAFTHNLAVITTFTVFAGLALDSLSSSRIGVSVAPLFALGFLLHTQQSILLRDQTFAQVWLGMAGGAAVPLATGLILQLGSHSPAMGWGLIWQLLLLAAFNGLMCPVIFRLFDHLQKLFEYQPVQSTSYRSDREIKRGRY
jgi:cell shape-determining protein MreD